jgi:hypothetical protein
MIVVCLGSFRPQLHLVCVGWKTLLAEIPDFFSTSLQEVDACHRFFRVQGKKKDGTSATSKYGSITGSCLRNSLRFDSTCTVSVCQSDCPRRQICYSLNHETLMMIGVITTSLEATYALETDLFLSFFR